MELFRKRLVMRSRLSIFFAILTLLAAPLRAADIQLSSGFEPAVVESGQYTRFIIVVNGSATSSMKATLPQVDGLVILDNPSTSSKVSIVNGSVTSYVQYVYSVRSTKDGTFTIPEFAVTVDGRKYFVPSASFTASKTGAADNSALIVEVDAPSKLFVGQSAEAMLRILIRGDLRASNGGINPRKSSGEEILQQPFDPKSVRQGSVRRGTLSYNALSVPMLITAVRAGRQTLTYDCDAQVQIPRRSSSVIGGGDPLQEMMRNMQSMTSADMVDDLRVVSAKGGTDIDVLPMPPDAPASFDGAIGRFTISRSPGTDKTKVGEPVELTVVVAGEGNFNQIFAPKLESDDDWRVYPPTDQMQQEDAYGLKGSKTFKYLLSPLRPGTLHVPPLKFSFLDASAGRYVEQTLQGESVAVANAPGAVIPPPAPKQAAAQPAQATDGLHPITLLYTVAPSGALLPPQRNKLFLIVQLVPALLLLWGVVVPLRRRRAARDPLARQRNACARAASAALSKALRAARAADLKLFFDQARLCLQNATSAADPKRRPDTVSAADIVLRLGTDSLDERRKINLLFNGAEALRHGSLPQTTAELGDMLTELAARLGVK
ncbi:MAG: BatD family protein [Opitutales bacterium]|jgi:hypothetical protein